MIVTTKLALEKMASEAMNKERRKELELYKIFAGDEDFRVGFVYNLERTFNISAQS